MRTTGLGLSALLVAAGAILAWAVTYEVEGVDLNMVGLILFFVGLGLGLITLAAAASGSRTTVNAERESVVNGQPVVEHQKSTTVQHDGSI